MGRPWTVVGALADGMRAPLLVRGADGSRAVVRAARTPLSADSVIVDGQLWWVEPYLPGADLDTLLAHEAMTPDVAAALLGVVCRTAGGARGTERLDGSSIRVRSSGAISLLGSVGQQGLADLLDSLQESYPTLIPPRTVEAHSHHVGDLGRLRAWCDTYVVDEAVLFETPKAGQLLGDAGGGNVGPPPRVVVAGTALVAMMVGMAAGRMLFEHRTSTRLVVEGAAEVVVRCDQFDVRASHSEVLLPSRAGRCTVTATFGNLSTPSQAVRVSLQPTIHCTEREGDLQCSDN